MNIGIDARLLSENITGISRFLINILKYLPQFDTHNKYALFTYEGIKYKDDFYSYSYIRKSKLPRQLSEHYWLNFVLPKLINDQSINLFFTPYILVPLNRGPYKNVIVIHDVMTKACEQYFTSYYKRYMNIIVPLAIKRRDTIVTVSESARQDIIKYYNVSPEKVHFMYLWTDEKYKPINVSHEQKGLITKKYSLPEKFILYTEDTDFYFRARKAGYKIYLAPLSKIFHKVNRSTKENFSALPLYYTTRNRLYFSKKNFHQFYFITLIYISTTMLLKSLYWVTTGNLRNISAIYRAFKDYFSGAMGKTVHNYYSG